MHLFCLPSAKNSSPQDSACFLPARRFECPPPATPAWPARDPRPVSSRSHLPRTVTLSAQSRAPECRSPEYRSDPPCARVPLRYGKKAEWYTPLPQRAFETACISAMPSGSRPFTGSSSSRISGFPSIAFAMPRRCRIPSEKAPNLDFTPVSPTSSNTRPISALSRMPLTPQ